MKTLITGGAGFVGSHVADRLLAQGDRVCVIDNYATGRRDNLAAHPNLTVVEGTIADRKTVDKLFDDFKPEAVVHAAASYKDPNNWVEDSLTNVLGTAHVVQAAQRAGVKQLIYFQTALCYGLHPAEQPIRVDHALAPGDSSYAISKTAGEHYVRLSGLNWISFRLANAYGPRNVSGPLPTFYQRLTAGKPCFVMDTRRDFIHIGDLVDVAMKALAGQGASGVYHVSSGKDFAIRELFDAAVKALGVRLEKDVEVRPRGADDAFTILLDPALTEKTFGWAVRTPLDRGVADAVAWYRAHPVEETFTHLKLPTAPR